tara:strand:+ start:814 stop:1464 length:651 start_codon:yes stop_codon:yes gene_type:complete
MHQTVKNLINIQSKVNQKIKDYNLQKQPDIIAVSKTFKLDHIMHLINHGHIHYGENKVQEAIEKWDKIKNEKSYLKLHLIGKLQTNKVKFAVKLFDYIHSLDSEKLAKKIASFENRNLKLFIQVNIGNEEQKSGIDIKDLLDFSKLCEDLKLNVIGLMCIPPFNEDPTNYFKQMYDLKKKHNFKEMSMGMSSDYISALNYGSTFLRIGSNIFGSRN